MKKKLIELKKTDLEILDELIIMLDESLSKSKQYYILEVEKYKDSTDEVDIIYVSTLRKMIDNLHRH